MSRPREAFCFRLQPQSLQTKIGRNQSQWEFVGQWQSAIIRNWQSQIEAGIKVNVNQDPLLKHVWRNRVPKPKMSSHNLAPTNQQQCVRVDSALNFPVICSPVPKRVVVNKYPHLQDLELADHSEIGQDAIDVLIGSDHYWDIITGESIREENGPTAVNNKFGWLFFWAY